MKNNIDKKYFITSFVSHFLIIVLFLLFNSSTQKINKRFLVFGAHSKLPTQAVFKSNRNLKTTNWFAKRQLAEKKIREKKAALKKQREIQRKKRAPKPVIKQAKKTPQKKATSLREAKKQTIPRKIQNKPQKTKKKKFVAKKDNIENEIHFNLMGETDPNLIKYQESIQKEVARLWKPPIGVPKGTECSVKFEINDQGKVKNFEILNKSNILIYDLSILRVAKKFKFDKFLWGRKFTIDFRQ
ncbi:hypothetical protein GF385_00725 [Candidatus Dependentiae bacterium]|nr:hypothetical protein [Candidatus Dependentiae bacterium]